MQWQGFEPMTLSIDVQTTWISPCLEAKGSVRGRIWILTRSCSRKVLTRESRLIFVLFHFEFHNSGDRENPALLNWILPLKMIKLNWDVIINTLTYVPHQWVHARTFCNRFDNHYKTAAAAARSTVSIDLGKPEAGIWKIYFKINSFFQKRL